MDTIGMVYTDTGSTGPNDCGDFPPDCQDSSWICADRYPGM